MQRLKHDVLSVYKWMVLNDWSTSFEVRSWRPFRVESILFTSSAVPHTYDKQRYLVEFMAKEIVHLKVNTEDMLVHVILQ